MLGSGAVGRALAMAFKAAGHAVVVGSRTPDGEDLQTWCRSVGLEVTEVGRGSVTE